MLESGVRRIDLGGKFMTNYLKELVSFRSATKCMVQVSGSSVRVTPCCCNLSVASSGHAVCSI